MDIHKRCYKERCCSLCKKWFVPHDPRSETCYACQDRGCVDCGCKISARMHRWKKNERRCMKCYAKLIPLGTCRKDHGGYISIKTKNGWMLEHRYLMEKKLHRKLKRKELVHHKDGNPSNNSLSNLVVCKSFRDHLDTYHKNDLKNPPLHHFGNRKWTDKERSIFNNKRKEHL